jgi:hypothetical protein
MALRYDPSHPFRSTPPRNIHGVADAPEWRRGAVHMGVVETLD